MVTESAVRRRPAEIRVRARLCNGHYRRVGDLIPYRSALWVVKGLYLVVTRSGESELYYILGETSTFLDAVEDS